MNTKPLLILAFNRPIHVKGLIDSLRPHKPQRILIGVDGPRKNNRKDNEKIALVLAEIRKIDWTDDIELRIRKENLGLRFAVADAVSWAIKRHGEIIVLEDDIEVGPEFLNFMSEMLDRYRYDESIGHISGYNLVPESLLHKPDYQARLSRIPESYAWATWARAWEKYDPNMIWASNQGLFSLASLLGSVISAVIWKINFYDAKKENINTWAYRWTAALWANKQLCVSPNQNLIKYTGQDHGTHTRTRSQISELEIGSLRNARAGQIEFDEQADSWIHRRVFRATLLGALRRIAESIILGLLRKLPRVR